MAQGELILKHYLSCIAASQEYQQTRGPLQEKVCIKNDNSFGGNCFSNEKISEISHFTVFSLPLYSFPIAYFFTITEEKNNLCFICISLWGVENEVQVIPIEILWWICKGGICRCVSKEKPMPLILPGAFSQVH